MKLRILVANYILVFSFNLNKLTACIENHPENQMIKNNITIFLILAFYAMAVYETHFFELLKISDR